MSTKKLNYEVLVFGAGPVGAAVALGLQQQGYTVCVCEKRSEKAVIIDAGRSINLSLSTRGIALLKELNVYKDLQSTLVPMVKRRFANGNTEAYREPLQSINRNLLTIELIKAAQASGVTFLYDIGFSREMFNEQTGECTFPTGESFKPRVIIGCDGVHGKISKFINPKEPERSSRASDWGYYELTIPACVANKMSRDQFTNFHIWPGKAPHKNEFIVGLPNCDGTITLTLFGLMQEVRGRMTKVDEMRTYLTSTYDGLDSGVEGLEEAVSGGFQTIFLNDHENLAGELGSTGTYVFLFGDAALGMEQFLGLAVNAGFEGAHRFLQHFHRAEALTKNDSFWRSQVHARNVMNAGVKALQNASNKNAASMRDGCDDPLGKAIRAVLEAKFSVKDINASKFESTHDWWSFCEVPLKVTEAVVAGQDRIVDSLKAMLLASRSMENREGEMLTAAETELVVGVATPQVEALFAERVRLQAAHSAAVEAGFAQPGPRNKHARLVSVGVIVAFYLFAAAIV